MPLVCDTAFGSSLRLRSLAGPRQCRGRHKRREARVALDHLDRVAEQHRAWIRALGLLAHLTRLAESGRARLETIEAELRDLRGQHGVSTPGDIAAQAAGTPARGDDVDAHGTFIAYGPVIRIDLIRKCGARLAGARILQPLRHRARSAVPEHCRRHHVIRAGPASSRFAGSIQQGLPSN